MPTRVVFPTVLEKIKVVETAGLALTTFFATIGPFGVSAVFAALTASENPDARRSMAIRGTIIAALILLAFALVGERILIGLGISLAALRISGGILLLLIGIEKVFAISATETSTTKEENEAGTKRDISVFPLATPLLAGPGSMGAVILLMADAEGDLVSQVIVVACLLTVFLFTLGALLSASKLQKHLGATGIHVIGRIMGVLLAALAVQFILDGIGQSGLVAV